MAETATVGTEAEEVTAGLPETAAMQAIEAIAATQAIAAAMGVREVREVREVQAITAAATQMAMPGALETLPETTLPATAPVMRGQVKADHQAKEALRTREGHRGEAIQLPKEMLPGAVALRAPQRLKAYQGS